MKSKFKKLTVAIVFLVLCCMLLSGCSTSNSSSRSNYKSPQQKYDEKYGAGEYEKDRQMIEDMNKWWPTN